MQFILMNYTKPTDHRTADDIAKAADGELWGAYTKALVEAGVLVGGEALHPSGSATTLRIEDGTRDIHDGPYADTKEQLGGFYVIDVPDLDTALTWAARNPAASSGAVEVRPVVQRG
ncbi:MAG: YciI family protein [Pseudomonadota bacterium]